MSLKERFNQVVETIKTYADSTASDNGSYIEYDTNVSETQSITYSEKEN